jgi:hypothetical protein
VASLISNHPREWQVIALTKDKGGKELPDKVNDVGLLDLW